MKFPIIIIMAGTESYPKVGSTPDNWSDADKHCWEPVSVGEEVAKTPEHKSRNVGNSDYAEHLIQPWDIWREYSLNPWDADIVKRVLRTKEGDTRKLDYEKIIHICQERIAQIDGVYE